MFERLALPGFARMGRYELLVTLGRLGLYEMRADSLHLAGGRAGPEDPTTLAAKRVFAIGDPLFLERRALAFAQELDVPIDALDLALRQLGHRRARDARLQARRHRRHALERVREAFDSGAAAPTTRVWQRIPMLATRPPQCVAQKCRPPRRLQSAQCRSASSSRRTQSA